MEDWNISFTLYRTQNVLFYHTLDFYFQSGLYKVDGFSAIKTKQKKYSQLGVYLAYTMGTIIIAWGASGHYILEILYYIFVWEPLGLPTVGAPYLELESSCVDISFQWYARKISNRGMVSFGDLYSFQKRMQWSKGFILLIYGGLLL